MITRTFLLSFRFSTPRQRHEADRSFHPTAATATAAAFGRKQHAGRRNGAQPAIGPQAAPRRSLGRAAVPHRDRSRAEEQRAGRASVSAAAAARHAFGPSEAGLHGPFVGTNREEPSDTHLEDHIGHQAGQEGCKETGEEEGR